MAIPPPEAEDKRRRSNEILKYTGTAFQMGATIAVGILLGKFLDRKFDTTGPYFTALFSALFSVAAIYLAIKDFLKKK